jgi:hypothetical protein
MLAALRNIRENVDCRSLAPGQAIQIISTLSRFYPIRANFVLTSCYPKRNIMLALFGNRPDFVLIAPISYCYPEAVSGLI